MMAGALTILLILSACSPNNQYDITIVPEGTKIPPLSAELRALCDIPGLYAGQDARVALVLHRAALLDCAERHGGVVAFYDKVRSIVNKDAGRETLR